jgi:GT2 family glycosyltransferase
MTDVSVILITYRMKDMLRALLESIREHTSGISTEIILVDNCSADGTVEMIRADFPGIRLIENDRNRGVAPARNQGLAVACGRYVVTLDADMVLTGNALGAMTAFMDATPDAGLCGCMLTAPDGEVQASARRFPTLAAFLLRRLSFLSFIRSSATLRRHEMAEWDRSDTRPVDYVIGACQFIRREAMEQVGLLDDHIFYGPEDLDYCLRMQQHGWRVYFLATARIIHYEQRITKKKLFSRLTLLHLKGIVYLFRKHGWKLGADC